MSESFHQSSSSGGDDGIVPPALSIWADVKERLGTQIEPVDYQKWLADMIFVAEVDGDILLAARDDLASSRVHKDYLRTISATWRVCDPRKRRVRIEARTRIAGDLIQQADAREAVMARRGPASRPAEGGQAFGGTARPLNDMTLDTLVVGEANRNAAALVQMLASGRLPPTGCVTLYGRPGAGKTHHLKAVAQAWADAGRGDEVVYITANEFLSRYVAGAVRRDTSELRDRVKGARLVLFDDLHVICGKSGTETAFFETMRAITSPADGCLQGHVIVAADLPPSEISGLSARIRGELQGGILIEIGMPDADMMRRIVEARVALIRQSAPEFDLSPALIDRIVLGVDDGPRVLTGVVCSLYSDTVFASRAVTPELVDEVIQRHVGRPVEPTLEEIKRAACEVFGITRAVLESKSRQRSHCEARHTVMHLARRMTPKSLPQIAKALGGMHHTSVMHGAERIQSVLDGKPLDQSMTPEQASAVRARVDQVVLALRAILAVRARASR